LPACGLIIKNPVFSKKELISDFILAEKLSKMDRQAKNINRPDIIRCFSTFILCLLISLFVTGCISAHSDVRYGRTGPAVSFWTLMKIQNGITTKSWLVSILGKPYEERQTPEGTQILKYRYLKKVDNGISMEPFFAIGEEKEVYTTIYFEVIDGIVTNFCKVKMPRGTFTLDVFNQQKASGSI
jgi:hypothetical protein